MTEELSGVTVVIIIGGGVLMIIIFFLFAKRQIMRFALRSRRGPHYPIGHGAKKSLKREIDRRIEVIPRIVQEPQLMGEEAGRYILEPPAHYFRLKAVDDIKLLEREIAGSGGGLSRLACESLRGFLLVVLAAPLGGRGQRAVHQLCDMYEHARHHPAEFGDEEYQAYSRLLLKLIDAARLLKPCVSSHKSSPSRGAGLRGLGSAGRLRQPLSPLNPLSLGTQHNKLTISNVHAHYTSLQNSNTIDYNFDDEVLRIPVESKPATPVVIHTQKTDNETTV